MGSWRTASIAISAIVALDLAACAGNATEQTDVAAMAAATATTNSATTQTRLDTTMVVSDETAQLRTVVEEAVGASWPSRPERVTSIDVYPEPGDHGPTARTLQISPADERHRYD